MHAKAWSDITLINVHQDNRADEGPSERSHEATRGADPPGSGCLALHMLVRSLAATFIAVFVDLGRDGKWGKRI